jgi:hypothetical protein
VYVAGGFVGDLVDGLGTSAGLHDAYLVKHIQLSPPPPPPPYQPPRPPSPPPPYFPPRSPPWSYPLGSVYAPKPPPAPIPLSPMVLFANPPPRPPPLPNTPSPKPPPNGAPLPPMSPPPLSPSPPPPRPPPNSFPWPPKSPPPPPISPPFWWAFVSPPSAPGVAPPPQPPPPQLRPLPAFPPAPMLNPNTPTLPPWPPLDSPAHPPPYPFFDLTTPEQRALCVVVIGFPQADVFSRDAFPTGNFSSSGVPVAFEADVRTTVALIAAVSYVTAAEVRRSPLLAHASCTDVDGAQLCLFLRMFLLSIALLSLRVRTGDAAGLAAQPGRLSGRHGGDAADTHAARRRGVRAQAAVLHGGGVRGSWRVAGPESGARRVVAAGAAQRRYRSHIFSRHTVPQFSAWCAITRPPPLPGQPRC